MPRIAIGLVFLSVAIGVHDADAQDNRLYAGVSAMWSTQGYFDNDPHSQLPSGSATAPGVAGEFGIFLPPKVHERIFSLSFEFSLPARFDSVQETDYFTTYLTDRQHRDLVLSGLFHVHAPPIGPMRLELVGGPNAAANSVAIRTAWDDHGTLWTFWNRDSVDKLDRRLDGWCGCRDSGQSAGPDRSTGSAALGQQIGSVSVC
jgi:hypothetical protein